MKFTAAQFVLSLLGLGVAAKQPNILFILTDDQGKEAIGGLEHMPELQVLFRPLFSFAVFATR